MTERCCNQCRTPFHGVCREKQTCWCHLFARSRDKGARRSHRDPTGERAVGNVLREQRKRGGATGG